MVNTLCPIPVWRTQTLPSYYSNGKSIVPNTCLAYSNIVRCHPLCELALHDVTHYEEKALRDIT